MLKEIDRFLEVRVISRHHLARLKIRLAMKGAVMNVDSYYDTELGVAATLRWLV